MTSGAIRELLVPRESQALEALYEGTTLRYPRDFEAFCLSHSWEEAEIGDVELADNPQSAGLGDLASAVRYDPILWKFLLAEGYLIFGRMSGGRYDPCVFDVGGATASRGTVVRVDHEEILSFQRLGRPAILAKSFAELLERVSQQ